MRPLHPGSVPISKQPFYDLTMIYVETDAAIERLKKLANQLQKSGTATLAIRKFAALPSEEAEVRKFRIAGDTAGT